MTQNHVTLPVPIRGHWLDLVITRSTCNTIHNIRASDGLSDHHTVIVDVNIPYTPKRLSRVILYFLRKLAHRR